MDTLIDNRFILLVEDNADDEELTLRALRKNNIHNKVIVARDGVEAIEFLHGAGKHAGRDTTVQPTMVLLDLNLPKLNGVEVLQRIRADKRTKTLPVIVLTSSDEEKDLIDSYDGGCNSYVRKPVDFVEFIEATGQIGLYWLIVNKTPVR